jgi:hypothetical protein
VPESEHNGQIIAACVKTDTPREAMNVIEQAAKNMNFSAAILPMA